MPEVEEVVQAVRSNLTDDLRRAPWKGSEDRIAGHCYVASEAVYHLLGGRDAGLTIYHIKHEGTTHWYLRDADGTVVDPTADQFSSPVPYEAGVGSGFLTREPSNRARILMVRVGRYPTGNPS